MSNDMMADKTDPTGAGDRAGMPRRGGRSRRQVLWLLAIPVVLYLLTPLVANTIHPVVLGLPFIVFYTIVVTVLTPAFVWLVARMDPLYRSDADEPVPADIAFGETVEGAGATGVSHGDGENAP